MKFIKDVIKGYKYLDEALEFAKESGLNINDAEIIRTNSVQDLVMYNPKNAAEMLKSMKNKSQSREQKILARQHIQSTTITTIVLTSTVMCGIILHITERTK